MEKTDSTIVIKQPGIYWVQSDYYGCSVRDSINTIQNTTPTVNLGTDTSICQLDSLLIDAGNLGATYLWQNGSTAQTFNATGPGTYIVKVTDVNGCSAKDSVLLNVYALAQFQLTNDTTICQGSSLTLSANGNAIQTWTWSPAATLSDPSISNPLATPIDTIIYTVNITDYNGCKESDSILVNVARLPNVTALADTTICSGSSVLLSTNATQGVSYLWSPSNGLSSNISDTPLATPSNDTKYIVTVTTGAGCKALDSVAIVVNPLPALVAGTLDSLICIGNNTTLAATSPTAVSYNWSPPVGLSDPSVGTPVATPNTNTNYIVEATDIKGCKAKDSVEVAIKQLPVFAIDPSSAGVCKGESVTITASGGDEYAWYPSNTLSTIDKPVTVATPDVTTTYKAVVTDNICAITDSVFTTINITSLSSIAVTKSNDIDCIIGSTILKATGGVIYNWSPGTYLSDSTIPAPIAAPLQTTTYYVLVSNASGCTGKDSITVNVFKGSVENGYKLPSAFTPNNDGNNDCFNVRKWGTLAALDFNVYNRWGNLIFHTTNASDCWDGTYQGKLQPSGAYIYQIRAQALCGTVYRKGTVVLVR
jgi:gliding motility-associated-like protein